MKPMCPLGYVLVLAASSACQKSAQPPTDESPANQAPTAKLGDLVRGDYIESFGQDQQGKIEHRFEKTSWSETHQDQVVELKLIKQQSQGTKLWSAVFDYSLPSSQERLALRVDLYKADATTLWICRHPQLEPGDPLEQSSADTTDTEGQGCFGAPWRQLKSKSAP